MNLRLPLVAAVVAAAAGASILRAVHGAHAPGPNLAFATAAPVPERVRSRERPPNAGIVVYVAGAVARAGLYTLPPTARGADALRAAGGAAPDADLVAVNLAARLADGDELAVPVRGATAGRGARARASSRKAHRRRSRKRRAAGGVLSAADGAGPAAPSELVDLNTAGSDELQTLPGVGPGLAERIVAMREQSGPFASADDLLDVAGMTQGKLDAIAPYISVR
jgi:competence protein ComEA